MKTILSILTLLIAFNITIAQTTAIPDPIFEQALINLGLDTGIINGVVPKVNIDTVTYLDVSNLGINDLTGIQDFTALDTLIAYFNNLTTLDLTQNLALSLLFCSNNQLTGLDVSQNTALSNLVCFSNSITSLNVSQNTFLKELACHQNLLVGLDISQNPNLQRLYCYTNQITSLNLSQNTALLGLFCDNNQLMCLNVKNGNNSNMYACDAYNNPGLTCIEVDNVAYSSTNWTNIDAQTSFSTNCGNPCSTGINEKDQLSDVVIYPNPTNRSIFIDFGKVKTNLTTTLTNSLGQVILTQQFESTDIINIDIEAPKGIYFLNLRTTDGVNKTIKVLKE